MCGATIDEQPILRVSEVSKTYGNILTTGNVQALRGVSFDLMKGEICGLVGPNGAGKSTLLKVIMGIEPSNGGDVRISSEAGELIGFVPERPIFFEDVSASYNLLYFARLARIEDPEDACEKALKDFGLEGRGDDPVSTFSKGMRQRLAMARAVLHKPNLLLMDEPFSGLDPSMMMELREAFKKLKGTGMTMLLSSHELNEIDQVCDAIVFIDKGKVVRKDLLIEEGALDVQISLAEADDKVISALSSWPLVSVLDEGRRLVLQVERAQVPDLVVALVSAGARVEEVRVLRRKAEERYADIFLKGDR